MSFSQGASVFSAGYSSLPPPPPPLWSLGLVDVWKPHLKDPGSITQELRCPCQSKLLMLAKFMHPVIYRVTRTSLHRNLPPFFPLYFFIRPLCLFSLILFWRSLQISLPAFLSGCDDLKRVFLGCQLNSRSWPDWCFEAGLRRGGHSENICF